MSIDRDGSVATPSSSQNSEVNTTMQDAMWRGHGGWEMALTPVLFGFFGYLLDGALGTSPVFLILLAVLGLAGSVANQYYRYRDRMELAAEERKVAYDAKHRGDA
ncbi:MAG: AtpZ/AtpI family protein [Acidimicrobiales bacterium]|nr:AtpZ/AtpI family protein [Acidimicrobiales bacterium]RZV47522.1 MAG: AtpZ/AtpI family protein [Acidimicrobiales bacterium]